MNARRRRPCDVPWFPHGLERARFYACGWRCDKHSPAALKEQYTKGAAA